MKKKDIKNENIVDNEQEAKTASATTDNTDASAETVSGTQANGSDEKAENKDENATQQPETEADPLEAALKEIEEYKDKYLRSVAEFDNYRKRTLKEKTELIINGGEKAITTLLPVLDDMERAMQNSEKTDDPQVLKEGMELIYTKFVKTLESMGVKAIDTQDVDFNTDVHEAIAMVPGMGDDKKGKVIDCVQKGYKINDKVIRHAKVAVGQ